jgi:hypothetical protein
MPNYFAALKDGHDSFRHNATENNEPGNYNSIEIVELASKQGNKSVLFASREQIARVELFELGLVALLLEPLGLCANEI